MHSEVTAAVATAYSCQWLQMLMAVLPNYENVKVNFIKILLYIEFFYYFSNFKIRDLFWQSCQTRKSF